MTGLIRKIVARISGLTAPQTRAAPIASPFLKARLEAAERALSKVRVPGYDVDLVSGGVVVKMRVSLDGSKLVVYLDYYGRNPGCSFCRFISDTLWAKIIGEARSRLAEEGFREVYFLDAYTGASIEPRSGPRAS